MQMQHVQYTRKLLNKHCFMENRTFISRYAPFLDPVLGSTAFLRIAEVLTTNWTQFTFQIERLRFLFQRKLKQIVRTQKTLKAFVTDIGRITPSCYPCFRVESVLYRGHCISPLNTELTDKQDIICRMLRALIVREI